MGALPFLIGACVGFTSSVWAYYGFSQMRAIAALKDSPTLLALHLRNDFPFEKWPIQRLRRMAEGKIGMVEGSMLVISWQSASGALEVRHLSISLSFRFLEMEWCVWLMNELCIAGDTYAAGKRCYCSVCTGGGSSKRENRTAEREV